MRSAAARLRPADEPATHRAGCHTELRRTSSDSAPFDTTGARRMASGEGRCAGSSCIIACGWQCEAVLHQHQQAPPHGVAQRVVYLSP